MPYGKKPQEASVTPMVAVAPHAIPSDMAVRHESKIQALDSDIQYIKTDIGRITQNVSRLEGLFADFANEVRTMIAKRSERNPSLYVAIAALAFTMVMGMITISSGLVLFTVNSIHSPTRDRVESLEKGMMDIHAKHSADHDTIIRNDEKWRLILDAKLSLPQSTDKQ